MSLSRALLGSLTSSARPRRWPPLHPAALLPSPFSTDAAAAPAKRVYKEFPKSPQRSAAPRDPPPLKPHSKLPRPSEIPFQPRVANSVHLVGTVGVPVQLQASPDGVYSAITVLVQEKTVKFPQFWIPVIFQGDLAEVAACHLKENDLIYVVGHISGDAPLLSNKDAQTNIRVLAHSVNFVENVCLQNEGHVVQAQDKLDTNCSDLIEENLPTTYLWNDLLSNPQDWWDNRKSKRFPTFKHKDSGQVLCINEFAPEWVLSKLDALSFCQSTPKPRNVKESENHAESLWTDLVANPQLWRDNRMDKLNRLINPKFPDFKHKDTNKALWLSDAPDWVLPKLEGLTFSESNNVTRQVKDDNVPTTQENGNESTSVKFFSVKEKKWASVSNKNNKESLWKDLLENSQKWWDNRSDKLNPKAPDFKHKETGEALWLDSSPSWVLQKLPPSKTQKSQPSHEG